MTWHGWRWTGGRWVKLAEARTIGEAHRRLNAALAGRRVPNRETALTGGAAPTWRPDQKETQP